MLYVLYTSVQLSVWSSLQMCYFYRKLKNVILRFMEAFKNDTTDKWGNWKDANLISGRYICAYTYTPLGLMCTAYMSFFFIIKFIG